MMALREWEENGMVRIATVTDAEQLEMLNIEFNGEGETTLGNIRASLASNKREIVVVDETGGELTGFVCVQLKKSFCYDNYMPEITEVYVKPQYRQRGIARAMIAFAEGYCRDNYPIHKFELLTGSQNTAARTAYKKLGYSEDGEIHLAKRFRR